MKDESCVYDLTAIPLPLVTPIYGDDQDRTISNKPDPGVALLWSGDFIPARGDRVHIRMNEFGDGTITGFFTEHGWLGLIVKLDAAPAWHRKQNRGHKYQGSVLVFGAEVKKLDPVAGR
jgi:hypothetical protein